MTMTCIKAAVLVAALASPALAHDWYPTSCCRGTEAGGDCAPLDPSEVERVRGGWRIRATGEVILEEEARTNAPDGLFHRCVYPSGRTRTAGGQICFWAPEAGT